jgi:hypothetical protein
MCLGAILIGLVAGFFYSLSTALGLAIVLMPQIAKPSSRRLALGIGLALFIALGSGIGLHSCSSLALVDCAPVVRPDISLSRELWKGSIRITRQFPLVGAGLGAFSTIYPYFKTITISSTTSMSTFLQWGAETGATGLAILIIGLAWSMSRVPACIKRVSSTDRALAYALIGAVANISLLAAVHWTIELNAVAVAVSAIGGTWNRWLAGGTDLFVERR